MGLIVGLYRLLKGLCGFRQCIHPTFIEKLVRRRQRLWCCLLLGSCAVLWNLLVWVVSQKTAFQDVRCEQVTLHILNRSQPLTRFNMALWPCARGVSGWTRSSQEFDVVVSELPFGVSISILDSNVPLGSHFCKWLEVKTLALSGETLGGQGLV